MSVMSDAIARAKNQNLRDYANRVLDRFCQCPDDTLRVPTAVAKLLLLHGDIVAKGNIYRAYAKSLGCGVQEVYLKPKNA